MVAPSLFVLRRAVSLEGMLMMSRLDLLDLLYAIQMPRGRNGEMSWIIWPSNKKTRKRIKGYVDFCSDL